MGVEDLYEYLLGLSAPWAVAQVDLDMETQKVDVYLSHMKGARFVCLQCPLECVVYGYAPKCTWRHLDSCQFVTYLHAEPPLIRCPEHGIMQANAPWADKGSRFTNKFEMFAIKTTRTTDMKRAAARLRRRASVNVRGKRKA